MPRAALMRPREAGLIGIAIVAISTAAVLIRGASEAPSLVITTYRLVLGSLLLVIPLVTKQRRRVLSGLSGRVLGLAALGGLFLAAHFATWIASLSYTNVASSIALVTAHPLFVAIGSRWLLKERVDRRTMIGILVGMGGIAWLTIIDRGMGRSDSLLGDGLAFAGCLFVTVYFLIGRISRDRIRLWTYVGISYTSAAAVMLAISLLAALPLTGYAPRTLLLLLLLALIPQGVGHTLINRALRHFPAPVVSLAILGEVPGATFLAWILLGESVPLMRALAVSVIVLAVVIALLPAGRKYRSPEATMFPAIRQGGGAEDDAGSPAAMGPHGLPANDPNR